MATEVQGVLFGLLARLRVDHDLAYADPAIVAGVGALVLAIVVGCCVEGIASRRYSVLVHRTRLLWAVLREAATSPGRFLANT
jgi:hypothetical protein